MFGTLAKALGQVIGESVHQADKLYEGTKELASDTIDSIVSIPQEFSKGYDEELFSAPEGGIAHPSEPKKEKEEVVNEPSQTFPGS